MPELLKNRYHYESLYELALSIRAVYPSFQVKDFLNGIMDETWEGVRTESPHAANHPEFRKISAG